MLSKINPANILFIDIETVPQVWGFENLPSVAKDLFDQKTHWKQNLHEKSVEEIYNETAGILAEFGKIVCISCGIITPEAQFRVKSFYGEDERKILSDFCDLLHTHFSKNKSLLCAHNGKEFDFPFIARRLIIHGISLPRILQIQGKKPWEIQHLDTLELWKFGDYKHYTSVHLLAHVLNIPSPKDDICGADVAQVYYQEKNINRIKRYCEKDVLAVAQIFRRFRNEELLNLE